MYFKNGLLTILFLQTNFNNQFSSKLFYLTNNFHYICDMYARIFIFLFKLNSVMLFDNYMKIIEIIQYYVKL